MEQQGRRLGGNRSSLQSSASLPWQHITLEYKRANGKAVFVSVTVNGKKSYFNKSFYPQAKAGTRSVGMHFQLNGDKYQQDYMVWSDKMTVKTW